MGFSKRNVELFLQDHARHLPPAVVALAEQNISTIADDAMLVGAEAKRIFGDQASAQWFLKEIEASSQHIQMFASSTSEDCTPEDIAAVDMRKAQSSRERHERDIQEIMKKPERDRDMGHVRYLEGRISALNDITLVLGVTPKQKKS